MEKYINNDKPCAFCKYFTMHFKTKEPESQRCKKYNKHVKMGDHLDCKGFKQKQDANKSRISSPEGR